MDMSITMPEGDRALGPTYAADQIGWIDFETASRTDIKKAGGTRYATEADAVMLAWAIGDGPVTVTAVEAFPGALRWADLPAEFHAHHKRVIRGEAVWAAFNAGFDRGAGNYATVDFPELAPHHIIDVMAQAVAAGLPPDLYQASLACGGTVKQAKEGKRLLALFCFPKATATPQSHPQEWLALQGYAHDDIEAMRSVFRCTRQLSLAEWREYWAMEAINDRGVGVDLAMAEHAAKLAIEDRAAASRQLRAITSEVVSTPGQVQKLTQWLLAQLPPEGVAILTKRQEEVDEETGEIIKPSKYQLTRARVQRLLAYCRAAIEEGGSPVLVDRMRQVERVLQIRLYGGSTTPAKFAKIQAQHVDGKLYGQYVFNGAGQTGRASSKGVQVHNLTRDYLPYEHDAIEALLAKTAYRNFAILGDDTPVSRKLSLLVRPTFVPTDGNVFVWSDWSQIEARVLPWLVGDGVPGAMARLNIFREVDADPSKSDLYTRTASTLSHAPIEDVTKAMRQRGKVAELALGFGGGVGALQAMGANYNLHLPDQEARETVKNWRDANPWCVGFWGRHDDRQSIGLWGAINRALLAPRTLHTAGRVTYVYVDDYLKGSLLCLLPSGRCLTYRDIRYARTADYDDDDNIIGYSTKLQFSRGYGRVTLWHGMACENIVQATAADVLRGTLVRLMPNYDVVLHTHDEIVLECLDGAAVQTALELRGLMQLGFPWSRGLPLMSNETIAPYYSKRED
jgi:DNA polymerase